MERCQGYLIATSALPRLTRVVLARLQQDVEEDLDIHGIAVDDIHVNIKRLAEVSWGIVLDVDVDGQVARADASEARGQRREWREVGRAEYSRAYCGVRMP